MCNEHCDECKCARQIAEDAANLAVRKVFNRMEVDVGNVESLKSFREDLRFIHKARKLSWKAVVTLVGLAAASLYYLLTGKSS